MNSQKWESKLTHIHVSRQTFIWEDKLWLSLKCQPLPFLWQFFSLLHLNYSPRKRIINLNFLLTFSLLFFLLLSSFSFLSFTSFSPKYHYFWASIGIFYRRCISFHHLWCSNSISCTYICVRLTAARNFQNALSYELVLLGFWLAGCVNL